MNLITHALIGWTSAQTLLSYKTTAGPMVLRPESEPKNHLSPKDGSVPEIATDGEAFSGLSYETSRRDLALLTIASVAPDLDGIGIIADALVGDSGAGPSYFETWHHVLGHNILAGVAIALLAGLFARNKRAVVLGAFGLFHLHLFCDLIGSRGPEGELWTISYLFPFHSQWTIAWSGQWEINAWPNLLLTVFLLGLAFKQARNQGFSPLWYLSARADEEVVETLRKRFPLKS